MIEIFKSIIDIILNVINVLFNTPIQLSNKLTIKLGFLVIGVILLTIIIIFLLNVLNINIGGDE